VRLTLKCGRGEIDVDVPDRRLVGVFAPSATRCVADGRSEIDRALGAPIESRPLEESVRPADRVAVVIDDSTRATPNRLILEALAGRFRAAALPPHHVTVIVATGLHRPNTPEELAPLVDGLGFAIENHDAHAADRLVELGEVMDGCVTRVNRTFADADVRILTGDVEFHQFVGFGGGAKSLFPGLIDAESIRLSHSQMERPGAGAGRLDGNPVRDDIERAGEMMGVHFIVNLVMTPDAGIIRAFAGDVREAFRAGVDLVNDVYRVRVPEPADLVIASCGGYPRDINLYQSQKGIEGAIRITKPGGRIALFAECAEGHGAPTAVKWLHECAATHPRERAKELRGRLHGKFVMGGHKAYQIAMELTRAEVFLHTALPDEDLDTFGLARLRDTDHLRQLIKAADRVAVLPDAVHTLALPPGSDAGAFLSYE